MIEQLRIVGEHAKADETLKQYVLKKIGQLDKYLPYRARHIVQAEVMLKEEKGRRTGGDTVEVLLTVPDERITAKASAPTMYMAVDLVEDKLKQQLVKYKDEHSPRFYRHLMRRFRRR